MCLTLTRLLWQGHWLYRYQLFIILHDPTLMEPDSVLFVPHYPCLLLLVSHILYHTSLALLDKVQGYIPDQLPIVSKMWNAASFALN